MKVRKRFLAAGIILVFCFGMFYTGMLVGADTAQPGTSGDPLITKSYLEERLKKINNTSDDKGENKSFFKKLTVKKGKSLLGEAGTEIILYSGSGIIAGKNFLLNISNGEKFESGNTAVKYNIYLCPVSGSGLETKAESVVFVRGEYKIK